MNTSRVKKGIKNPKKVYIILKEYFNKKCSFFIRKLKKPKYPKNKDGKILLHLGCGEFNNKNFINVDARPWKHVHHIQNITNLSNFKENYADLVYACMVLEHIQVSEIKSVLDQWKRVLKKGGVLRLTVPNFDSIIQVYKDNKNDVNAIANPLMGGQGYKYNFHYSIFNKVYLRNLLKKSGFRDVKTWDPKNAKYYDFNDWASRNYKINGKEYNISLNLEAIK